jgi:hypothetical protein
MPEVSKIELDNVSALRGFRYSVPSLELKLSWIPGTVKAKRNHGR